MTTLTPTETMRAIYRARRKRLGISQTQLAAVIGVVMDTLSRWERGEVRPDFDRWDAALRRLEGER